MLAAAILLSVTAFTGPKIDTDIVYSRAGGEEIKMDIYSPPNVKPGDKLPAVVVIHGGAWISGSRKDMVAMATGLAENGFVAANIEYRLGNAKNKYPVMLDDVQTAVRFLRANAAKYGIDPKRIGAAGASAGGHLSLMLGSTDTRDPKPAEYPDYSSKVQAVFNLFGPVDMSLPFPKSLDFVFVVVIGKKKEEAAAEIKAASPITYIDKTTAPVFTIQGLADPLVNPQHARLLDAALLKAGVDRKTVFIEGMGHDIDMSRPEVKKAVEDGLAFMRAKLAPAVTKSSGK